MTPARRIICSGHGTVLVVEDNATLRRATMRHFSQSGYEALEAEHAEAAFRLPRDGVTPDLRFTEVVIPGSPDEVRLANRAVAFEAGLRVLLTSGFPSVRRGERHMAECPFYQNDDGSLEAYCTTSTVWSSG